MAEINVTPLVDVMLVLLIIFMVTAPLLVAGVPVELPESRAKALAQEADQITLSIDARGQVFLDEAEVAPGELAERLEGLRCGAGAITIDEAAVSEAQLPAQLARIAAEPAPEEGRRIYLRADKGLDYGRVMHVMGELNRAGLNRVALVSVGGDAPPAAPDNSP